MPQSSSFQNRKEKRTSHLTHAVTETMVLQTKNRLFWPRMRQDLENHNSQCKPCTEIRISRAQKPNEVNMGNLFETFSLWVKFRLIMQRKEMVVSWYFDIRCPDSCRFTRPVIRAQSKPCWSWESGVRATVFPCSSSQIATQPSGITLWRSAARWMCELSTTVPIILAHSLGLNAQ